MKDYRIERIIVMPYVTVPQSPIVHQITFEEILRGVDLSKIITRTNATNTRTYFVKYITDKHLSLEDLMKMIDSLKAFNIKYADLLSRDRATLYDSFVIPKKSGGLRHIDAPKPELYSAQLELKNLLEELGASYHTSASAYIKGRSTIDALKRHQYNQSEWFLKLDFHDFFGSTTKEFVLSSLETIFPFSEICKTKSGKSALSTALDLCFLNGGLPQGTVISPMLTNLIMIPIDYTLSEQLRERKFVYTRYADDMLISSRSDFPISIPLDIVKSAIKDNNAPFTLNDSKTRKGSRAGANWNLGLMLNKDNEITIGHKNKKKLRAMLHNYIMDKANNIQWSKNDVQTFSGLISYYRMVEPKYVNDTIQFSNDKFKIDVMAMIKADLSF